MFGCGSAALDALVRRSLFVNFIAAFSQKSLRVFDSLLFDKFGANSKAICPVNCSTVQKPIVNPEAAKPMKPENGNGARTIQAQRRLVAAQLLGRIRECDEEDVDSIA